jgi:hypothetical protein
MKGGLCLLLAAVPVLIWAFVNPSDRVNARHVAVVLQARTIKIQLAELEKTPDPSGCRAVAIEIGRLTPWKHELPESLSFEALSTRHDDVCLSKS